MVFSQLRMNQCWGLCCGLVFLLSACSTAHRFTYQYSLVSPGPAGVVDDEWVHIELTPTPTVGVVKLAITNKSSGSIALVWPRTYYLDPLGRPRRAFESGAQNIFRAPGWYNTNLPIPSRAAVRLTVSPGDTDNSRVGSRWRTPGAPDTRVPRDEEFYTSLQGGGQIVFNPFTVSRYADGSVALSSAPAPLVPTSGDLPAYGETYKGQEFRLVLALQLGSDIVPYTFIFRITDVQVR